MEHWTNRVEATYDANIRSLYAKEGREEDYDRNAGKNPEDDPGLDEGEVKSGKAEGCQRVPAGRGSNSHSVSCCNPAMSFIAVSRGINLSSVKSTGLPRPAPQKFAFT